MKKFNIPIKETGEDYIITSDVWLTLNEDRSGFEFIKKDNKFELIVAFSPTLEALNPLKEIPAENLVKSCQLASEKDSNYRLVYVNTNEKTLTVCGNANYFCLLIKRAQKTWKVLSGQETRIKIEMDDVFICFNSQLPEDKLAGLMNQLVQSPSISHIFMVELAEEMEKAALAIKPFCLIDFSPHQSYSFPITSSLKTITLTIDMIKNKVLKHHSEKIWQIETVLHEALVNAITYGNEMEYNKPVHICYEIGDKGMRIMIRDVGEGFDVTNISVPVGVEALERISGRGIYIMKKFSDRMYYNQKGNEVLLYFNF